MIGFGRDKIGCMPTWTDREGKGREEKGREGKERGEIYREREHEGNF
jgi:hypothetical protein